MKIRITDLLDEYLDDDLPLDAMPDILPGDRSEAKSSRAAHRSSHRKRAGQIVAAVLIVASISVAGGLKLWGGEAGKSLSDTAAEASPQAAEQQTAEAATALTTEEPDTAVEYAEDTSIIDGGYMTSTISVDGDGVNISAGDVSREGSTYSMKITMETPMEHVTGFLLDDYDAYLVLADGTAEEVTSSSETSDSENPFVKTESFTFDGLSESELAAPPFIYKSIPCRFPLRILLRLWTVSGTWAFLNPATPCQRRQRWRNLRHLPWRRDRTLP